MQRVTVRAFGGPEQLTVATMTEEPRPGRGQVLVDVEAAGVNYLDVYQRKGLSPVPLPFAPGLRGLATYVRSAKVSKPTTSLSVSGWHGSMRRAPMQARSLSRWRRLFLCQSPSPRHRRSFSRP